MGVHGRALGSPALTGNSAYKQGMAPALNDVSHAAPPYDYRCPRCNGTRCDANRADELAAAVGDYLREESHVVVGVGGFYKNVTRFQPPLTVSREQLEYAVEELETTLETVS